MRYNESTPARAQGHHHHLCMLTNNAGDHSPLKAKEHLQSSSARGGILIQDSSGNAIMTTLQAFRRKFWKLANWYACGHVRLGNI